MINLATKRGTFMKTEQIIYLTDIAQTNSITQTAQRFFISQQALSATIKKLEDEFNTTFLQRTNKGVVLTEEGNYFLEQTRHILDIYFKMKDDFSYLSLNAPPILMKGELHIFCHTRILGVLLIDILEQFIKRYPQIKISLNEKENLDIIDGVSHQDCDFGIIFAPDFIFEHGENNYIPINSYSLPENIESQILFSDKFIICCSKQHPLANKDYIFQQDLDYTPMILFDSNPVMHGNSFYTFQNQQTKIFSNNIQFHKDLLLRGIVASCITSFEFRKLYLKYKNLTAIPMENYTNSNITLVTNSNHHLSPQAQLFIQMLKRYDFYQI